MEINPDVLGYRHYPKVSVPEEPLDLEGARLKCYSLARADTPVAASHWKAARSFLVQEASRPELVLRHDLGFVILHRCGEDFYFLLPSVWRTNELWEAVYYADGGGTNFAAFNPANPGPVRSLRPTFCVWELGIVHHEVRAWSRFLASDRDEPSVQRWLDDRFAGQIE